MSNLHLPTNLRPEAVFWASACLLEAYWPRNGIFLLLTRTISRKPSHLLRILPNTTKILFKKSIYFGFGSNQNKTITNFQFFKWSNWQRRDSEKNEDVKKTKKRLKRSRFKRNDKILKCNHHWRPTIYIWHRLLPKVLEWWFCSLHL